MMDGGGCGGDSFSGICGDYGGEFGGGSCGVGGCGKGTVPYTCR